MAIKTWIADLVIAGKAPATVRLAVGVLSKALRAAVEAGILGSNPARGIKLPKIERGEVASLDHSQVAELADAIDPRYRALVLLGAYGGLRFGELAGLRRSRVDLVRRTVRVDEIVVEIAGVHHWGQPKTAKGRRTVPIPRFVADELQAHVGNMGSDELVFTAPEGGPLRASLFRRRFFAPAVNLAGLSGLTPHGLRHTAVSFWINAGATAVEVAKRAGHESVVTVFNVYGHLLPDGQDKLTDAVEAAALAALTAQKAPADIVKIGAS